MKELGEIPTVSMINVTLMTPHILTLSGLNAKISNCDLESLHLIVQQESSLHQVVENLTITLHSSSFGSLDLRPRTEAFITDCHIDAALHLRPTLITTNNSKVVIWDSYFSQFVAENGPTILHGHSNSIFYVKQTTFYKMHGLHGIIGLHDSCNIYMENIQVLSNVVYDYHSSPFTFWAGVEAMVNRSIFDSNVAPRGGAIMAGNKSQVSCLDTVFIKNHAIERVNILAPENITLSHVSQMMRPRDTLKESVSSGDSYSLPVPIPKFVRLGCNRWCYFYYP